MPATDRPTSDTSTEDDRTLGSVDQAVDQTVDEPADRDEGNPERVAVLKHSRASRWMHWINFPLIFIMIWSGFRIYWANDVYRIGWGDWTLIEFFPQWVYDFFQLDRKLAKGLAFHLTFGWLFAINGVAFGIYLAKSIKSD